MLRRHPLLLLLAAFVLAGIAASCSPRKNTAATRRYQAFITKYNIYYNGDTHYKETLKNMETNYEDDYSQLVFMHPIEAKSTTSAPQPQGDFTRSIEKGQKAIQLRSIRKRPAKKGGRLTAEQKAWYKRDEYNPFLHNAWMLMARGQYFNGDFAGAASTFFYISRHFTWLPSTVTEAELWQARAYISMDWLFEAEVIINRIKPDDLPKDLKGLYNFVKADFHIKSNQLAEAVPFLIEAINDASGAQKTRLRFLLGQIYSRLGQKQEAYKAFAAAGSSPSAPYRTKFNTRIKQSEVYEGDNIEPEVKALRRMLRYDRNKDYQDQIYYAIGNLYLSRGDTTHAIENYVLAAEKSTRNGIDKAIGQVTLGNLYFARHQYQLAQPCYAEAVPQLPKEYPNYDVLKRRSDVLDELTIYAQNVTLQDSLLRLAEMTPEQRLEVVNKLIEELKRKEAEEAEEARREEFRANQAAQGQQPSMGNASQAPNSFVINADNSWYFYNTATRNAGKTEFQRRWGARKLEDNWRRRNKSQFSFDDFDSGSSDDDADEESTDDTAQAVDSVPEADSEAAERAADPHYPEYYLAQIPDTEEQEATAHEVIQEGLYNMGVILKDKLEDFDASRSEFSRLLTDYPDNVYRLDTYYNLYLMYMREKRPADAETYRQLILSDFADSPIGQALQNPDYLENLRNQDAEVASLYEQTYDDYLENRNENVHQAYNTMVEKYPLSKTMPKFMFLHALAYVTEKRPDDFNNVLREMLERYPDTDITPIASAWLKGMAQGRELHSDSTANMRGMIWDMRLSNDSTATADGAANFKLSPDDLQLLIMTFATDEVSSNALLYEIARHNFKSFVVKDFELEQLNFGRLGMIVIRDFANMDELNHYRSVMAASSEFKLPRGVRPVVISDENFKLMLSQGRSFDEYIRFLQEQNYEDTQADLLVPDDRETLQEADESADIRPDDTEFPEVIEDPEPTQIEPTIIEPEPTVAEPEPALPVELPEPQPTPAAPANAAPEPAAKPVEPATPATPAAKPEAPTSPAAPAQPATAPAAPVQPAQPASQPTSQPAKPAKPAQQPVIVPQPSRPAMPTYDPGSEGDDPLFE